MIVMMVHAAAVRVDYFDGGHFAGYAGFLVAIGTVLTAVRAVMNRRGRYGDTDEDDLREQVRAARLENYAGRTDMATERLTQMLVDLSAKVTKLQSDYDQSREDVKWLQQQLTALKLRTSRQASAVRRYIDSLAAVLRSASIPVPPPDPNDLEDLADVLPEDTLTRDEVSKLTKEGNLG